MQSLDWRQDLSMPCIIHVAGCTHPLVLNAACTPVSAPIIGNSKVAGSDPSVTLGQMAIGCYDLPDAMHCSCPGHAMLVVLPVA